jgi:arylsulfatase A-like enzyme
MEGMSQRRLAAAVALVALALASSGLEGAGPQATAAPGERPETPNVLVFVMDDQRAHGTLNVMKATRRYFLDKGVHYRRAFATSPLCCPSRASIFTGQYAHNHGVLTNSESDMPQNETIQAYLNQAGYDTAIFGKYLNAWDLDVDPPHFDKWAIFKSSQHSYGGSTWNIQGEKKEPKTYPTTLMRRKAIRYLKGRAEDDDARPWAMFLPVHVPHLPAVAQNRYANKDVGDIKPNPAREEKNRWDKPGFVRTKKAEFRRARRLARRQRRTLLSADNLVKRVMSRLDELNEARDTIAFFLSDNGFLWGEHKLIGSTASKQNPYTDAIRIPLIVRWPGHLKEGGKDGRLAATIDVTPTIMDAVGLDRRSRPPMDGRSLFRKWSRGKIFLEFFTYPKTYVPSWSSIRTREYQYVEYYNKNDEVKFREYYNLDKDPWQLVNIYKDGKPGNNPNSKKLSAKADVLRSCVGQECP